jgi:hypothetical protein
MKPSQDQKIYKLCIKYIEKSSMDTQDWKHTLLGQMHDGITELEVEELSIISVYFSPMSWIVLTTRRVLGNYFIYRVDVPTENILRTDFGNFKGYADRQTEVLVLLFSNLHLARLEYETGIASMALISYFKFWEIKYPILNKLVG